MFFFPVAILLLMLAQGTWTVPALGLSYINEFTWGEGLTSVALI